MKKIELLSLSLIATGMLVSVPSYAVTVLKKAVLHTSKFEREEAQILGGVTKFGSDTITTKNNQNLGFNDLIKSSPGVTAQHQNMFSIRGIGSEAALGSHWTRNPLISIYQDGSPVALLKSVSEDSLWDGRSVEILRGPQSAKQGKNSMGGAIVIKYNDPIFIDETKVKFALGTGDYSDFGFTANRVLSTKTAVRISKTATGEASGLVNSKGEKTEKLTSEVFSFKVLSKINPNTNVLFSHRSGEQKGGAGVQFGYTGALTGKYVHDTAIHEIVKGDTQSNTLNIKHRLANGSSLNVLVGGNRYDLSGTADNLRYKPIVKDEITKLTDYKYDNFIDSFLSFTSGKNKVNIGIYASKEKNGELRKGLYKYGDQDVGVYLDKKMSTDTVALYSSNTYDVNKKTAITYGVRLEKQTTIDDDKFSFLTFNAGVSSTSGPVHNKKVSTGNSVLLPEIGVSYKINDSQLVKASYRKGYRSGGTSIFTSAVYDALEHTVFKPETLDYYELNTISKWNNGINTKVNVYYSDWKNMQLSPDGKKITNVGKAKLYGIEIEADKKITPAVTIGANATYQKTKITTSIDPKYENKEFPYVPNQLLNVFVKYNKDKWSLKGDISYTGKAKAPTFTNLGVEDDLNAKEISAYTTVNASTTYAWNDKIDLNVSITNLFNKKALIWKTENWGLGKLNKERKIMFTIVSKF